jgi:hypothetical protein
MDVAATLWAFAVALCLPPLSLADGLPCHAACVSNRDWADTESWRLYKLSDKCWPENPIASNFYYDRHRAFLRSCNTWSAAANATDPKRWAFTRRVALARLLDLAGERAVVTGELEPPQWLIPASQ